MRSWFERTWLPAHPDCDITYPQILENPPHHVFGITKSEYLESMDEFRMSLEKTHALHPNPEIQDWLNCYGERYRHLALTARPLQTMPLLAEWIYSHFGEYIRTVSIVPVRLPAGIPQYDESKQDFLKWIGKVDILVDDAEGNIEAANSIGVHGVLFPQPWNSNRLSVFQTLDIAREIADSLEQ
jgi:hypothetical protein